MSTFANRLTIALTLTIDGTDYEVAGGDVKSLEVDLRSHGFTARVRWWSILEDTSETDELFAPFITNKLVTAKLSIDRTFDEPGEVATPLVLNGIVRDKSVLEQSFPGVTDEPVMQRRYEIHLEDRARLLWSMHFPTAAYVDKTLKDVVDAHTPTGLTISSTWSGYTTARPFQSFHLGAMDASFYDFLHFLFDKENVALAYDVDADTYEILAARGTDEAESIPREDVLAVTMKLPSPTRYVTNVLNGANAAAEKKKVGTNEDAVTGIRRDVLVVSSLASVPTDRATLELARDASRKAELHLAFAQYPSIALRPSMNVSLGEGWTEKIAQHGKTYAIERLFFTARAESEQPTDASGDASNTYEITYEAELVDSTDTVWRRPAYRTPSWPFHVEGTVVSEQGETDQGTYQAYTNQDTSLDYHHVKVPLFDDLVVSVPYDVGHLPGHFYFPAFRDQKVRVAMHLDAVHIARFLDFRPGARLPAESQGNHLLLGKKDADETSISHQYEDGKPKLTIHRTFAKDIQTVVVREGVIRMETYEEKEGA